MGRVGVSVKGCELWESGHRWGGPACQGLFPRRWHLNLVETPSDLGPGRESEWRAWHHGVRARVRTGQWMRLQQGGRGSTTRASGESGRGRGETAGLVPERYWRVLSHHQSGITSLWVELLPSFRKSWQQTAAIWLLWIPMCLYRLSYYHCLVLWFSFSGQATIAGLEGSGDIVSVSCTENEIFFLKGDRNIIRISSRPEGLASVGLYLL